MSTRQLHIWKTLGDALRAPFSLDAASWKALAKPGLALVILSVFPFVVRYFQWGGTVLLIALMPIWAAVAWFAMNFQRHLLLGTAACEPGLRPWRQYGLYLLALVLVCVFLAVFMGMLLYLVLPAMVWFLMAINSPSPWLASGTVVIWILVVGTAAYPSVRLALILPAVTVDHDVALMRIWRLSRSNGLRLLLLLILIPGLLNGLLYLAVEADNHSLWITILASLLDTYLVLVYLSILAFAYRTLSGDQQLPSVNLTIAGRWRNFSARILWPLVLISLVGLGGIAVWNSLYRVEPGENIVISRLGKPERIVSEPGIKIKIPLIEDTQLISKRDVYRTEGMGRFLTMTKDTLSLNYNTQWHVANAEVFARTTSGQFRLVEIRIDNLLKNELRHRIAKLSQDEVRHLLNAGMVEFSIDEKPHRDAILDGVLENINSRVMDFGIEITAWRIKSDNRPEME